jgi:hypothetical protein
MALRSPDRHVTSSTSVGLKSFCSSATKLFVPPHAVFRSAVFSLVGHKGKGMLQAISGWPTKANSSGVRTSITFTLPGYSNSRLALLEFRRRIEA